MILKLMRHLLRFSVAALLLPLGGCEVMGYYQQAISGHLGLLSNRKPVQTILKDPSAEKPLKARLSKARDILKFAENRLLLDPEGSYSTIVKLNTPYVVWNTIAAPEFSVAPLQWCYPVVGCASYRGYFRQIEAEKFAQKLERSGFDAQVDGAVAYSTLGWFKDPLLTSFLGWSDTSLAALLFHELAHKKIFVSGDTAFNESFATFVGQEGVEQWLSAKDAFAELERFRQLRQDQDRFLAFLLYWRDQLSELYQQPIPTTSLRMLKGLMMEQIEVCYRIHRDQFRIRDFDAFFRSPLDNARLASLSNYHRWVGAFHRLFTETGSKWALFYHSAAQLAKMSLLERTLHLERLAQQQKDAQTDDRSAKDVQCEPFSYHVFDTELPGAEHDDIGSGGHW